MRIGFTGHRDRIASPECFGRLLSDHPAAVWICGGARGFDFQVIAQAQAAGIELEIVRPDYEHYGRSAPFVRNRAIVAGCDLLIACYDGRPTGGTFYTIRHARSTGRPVRIWAPSGPI